MSCAGTDSRAHNRLVADTDDTGAGGGAWSAGVFEGMSVTAYLATLDSRFRGNDGIAAKIR